MKERRGGDWRGKGSEIEIEILLSFHSLLSTAPYTQLASEVTPWLCVKHEVAALFPRCRNRQAGSIPQTLGHAPARPGTFRSAEPFHC